MKPLSASFRKTLASAVEAYAAQVEIAIPYLVSRGLDETVVAAHRLGFVAEPMAGHERFSKHLVIPYFTVTGNVCGMRFRKIDDITTGNGPKYQGLDGVDTRLYNLGVMSDPLISRVTITEGEIDAITLTACGYPAVAVPGAANWKPHHPRVFEGFEDIPVMADGDSVNEKTGKRAGHEFAQKVAASLPSGRVIYLPEGEDVNSVFVKKGQSGIDELFKESE